MGASLSIYIYIYILETRVWQEEPPLHHDGYIGNLRKRVQVTGYRLQRVTQVTVYTGYRLHRSQVTKVTGYTV